jgi:hypothetical protein
MGNSGRRSLPWIAFLLLPGNCWAATLSFTGSLDPNNANDVFLTSFVLSGSAAVSIQTWGYGGAANAPGGTNAAGMVIPPGGFDPYISVFAGIGGGATFSASNDDGSCPPGAPAPAYHDSTLNIALAEVHTLSLTVFANSHSLRTSGAEH